MRVDIPESPFSALCFQFNFSGFKCQDFYLCISLLHFLLVCTNGCEADGLIIVWILEEIILSSYSISRGVFLLLLLGWGFCLFCFPRCMRHQQAFWFCVSEPVAMPAVVCDCVSRLQLQTNRTSNLQKLSWS